MSSNERISFEEYLARYGTLTYRNKGASMMPLLRQSKDLFTLAKKSNARCKRYDVVLYKDHLGRYILHRVIRVRPDGYIIRGDNTYTDEFRTDDEILGVMTGFVREGREYKVTDIVYIVYSILRTASYPFRYAYIKSRRAASGFLRSFSGKNDE